MKTTKKEAQMSQQNQKSEKLANPVNIEVTFRCSENLQKQLLAEGKNGSEFQSVIITTTNPRMLKLAQVQSNGKLMLKMNFKKPTIRRFSTFLGGGIVKEGVKVVLESAMDSMYGLDEIPSEEFILHAFDYEAIEKSLQPELKKIQAECDAANVGVEEKIAAYQKKLAEEKENQARYEAERKEKEVRLAAETDAWIKANGSQRLRMMYTGGYEFRQTYEIERGALELPEALYNQNGDTFDYVERGNPSEEALLLAEKYMKMGKGYSAEVVWVKGEQLASYFGEMVRISPEWSRRSFFLRVN